MRVGVVGIGRIGQVHATHCRAAQPVSTVDVVDPAGVPPALAELDATWHPRLTPALAGRWDAAVVATPTAAHYEIVDALLAAGVPTFCEKPITADPGLTERLGARAEARGVPLCSGLQRRLDDALVGLRELIGAGRLGRVLSVWSGTHDPAPPPLAFLRTSGGMFLDMHVHDFDVLAWLVGEPIRAVRAVGASGVPAIFHDIDDHGVTSAAVAIGESVVGRVSGSRWCPTGYEVTAGALGTQAEATVDGRGRLVLRDAAGEHVLRQGTAHRPAGFTDRFRQAYADTVGAFLSEVDGGPPRAPSWRDDVRAVAAAASADRSARADRRAAAQRPAERDPVPVAR